MVCLKVGLRENSFVQKLICLKLVWKKMLVQKVVCVCLWKSWVEQLICVKSSRAVVPQTLRAAAVQASIARWSALLTRAAHVPLAASLIIPDPAQQTSSDGDIPPFSTLLEHCPLPRQPPSPNPRHPVSVHDLEGRSKWPGTWSAETGSVTLERPAI